MKNFTTIISSEGLIHFYKGNESDFQMAIFKLLIGCGLVRNDRSDFSDILPAQKIAQKIKYRKNNTYEIEFKDEKFTFATQ